MKESNFDNNFGTEFDRLGEIETGTFYTNDQIASLAGNLLERTITLMCNRPRKLTYELIAASTGLKIGWLSMLATGRIRHPSVNSVQILYEFLTQQKIF